MISFLAFFGVISSDQSHLIIDKILDQFIDKSPKDLFKVWHHLFKKTYTLDSQEARDRFAIFKNNLKEIKEHNAKENAFKVGLNQFSDMTKEEFNAQYANLKLPTSEELEKMIKEIDAKPSPDYDDDDLTKRNLRTGLPPINYSKFFSPARHQGQCGSCWAFSTVGAVEGAYGLKQGGPLQYLSTQQLVDCNTNNMGCKGGYMDRSYAYVKTYGIELETSYPYRGIQQSCQYNSSLVKARVSNFYYCSLYTSYPCTLNKVYDLLKYGPGTVTIDASAPYFNSYKTGVFISACGQANHAVILAGVGNDSVYGDYWLIRNSWGTTWGEAGYVRVRVNPQNRNSCNIEEQIWVPIP